MNINQKWMAKYELLKEYKEEYGHIDVPASYEKNGIKLGSWLLMQRQAYKGNRNYKISENKVQLLEELGIKWQIRNKTWEDYYELLKEYQKGHGNIDVPISYEKDEMKLGIWLYNQRQIYKGKKSGSLTEKQKELLEELGINWKIREISMIWEDYYELLKEYKKEHGNIDVPYHYQKNQIKLGAWLHNQRLAYEQLGTCKLTEKRIQLLEELGINWHIFDQKWNQYYELLKEYKKKYGNINVQYSYEKDGKKLGIWLSNQKQIYNGKTKGNLNETRIQLLEELGMSWDKTHRIWNDYYEQLKEYKEEHGNIDVPTYYQVNQIKLGVWLHHQRQAYKGQKPYVITKNQIRLLNELNIDWSIQDTKFLQKTINEQTQEKYQQILLERVNHIIDDLVYEGINDIDSTNQKEIEKVMMKRIWR